LVWWYVDLVSGGDVDVVFVWGCVVVVCLFELDDDEGCFL